MKYDQNTYFHLFVLLILILSLTVIEKSNAEDFLCSTLWGSGEMRSYLRDLRCVEHQVDIITSSMIEGEHKLYHPPDWLDQEKLPYLEATIEAVSDTLITMNELKRETGAKLVTKTATIFGVERTVDIEGFAAHVYLDDFIYEQPCPILVDPSSFNLGNVSSYKQIIAHELFHCYQRVNNPGKPSSSDDWWVEGSTNFLSNLVYPNANLEHRSTTSYDPTFPPFSHTRDPGSLHDKNPYATSVFFQHLANTHGTGWVLDRIFSLPRKISEDKAHEAVSNWPNIEETFHKFNLSFFDRNIRDSGGGNVPVGETPNAPTYLAIDDGTLEIAAYPFVFQNQKIYFFPSKSYRLSLRTEGARGSSGAKKSGSGDSWAALPTTINTPCEEGEGVGYDLIVTSTAPPGEASSAPHKLIIEIDMEDREDCDSQPPLSDIAKSETSSAKDRQGCRFPKISTTLQEYLRRVPNPDESFVCELGCLEECWCSNPKRHEERAPTLEECHEYLLGGDEFIPWFNGTYCEYAYDQGGPPLKGTIQYLARGTIQILIEAHCVRKCTVQCHPELKPPE